MSEPAVRRRTGGRSARVREAVLKATLHTVAEHGADAVSISEIARQADVHETSIYRRWPTKEHLVLDALLDYSEAKLPIPNTGTLRDDLVAFSTAVTVYLDSPLGRTLVRSMVLRATTTPWPRDAPSSGSRDSTSPARSSSAPRTEARSRPTSTRPPPSNSSSHRCTFGHCSPAGPSTNTTSRSSSTRS